MNRPLRILSIDGGGIRGIIPGQVLRHLEGKLKELEPSATIASCFDLIAGTSTGGILTCLYLCPDDSGTRPRYSAAEAVELYLQHGEDIFDIDLWHRVRSLGGLRDEKYPAAPLEALLQSHFGDVRLSQLLKPCVVTAYDIRQRRAMFFNQSGARREPAEDFLVREVARATSAAPTFFECAQIRSLTGVRYPLVDGGVFANNPALCAYAEARKMEGGPTAREMLVLSLGTGEQEAPYYHAEARDWGLAQWAVPVIDIMMSGVSETVDYQIQQIFGAVERPDQYLRMQSKLEERNSAMDNANRDNLSELADIGLRLAEDNSQLLTEWARRLTQPQTQPRPGLGGLEGARGADDEVVSQTRAVAGRASSPADAQHQEGQATGARRG